MSSQNIYTCDFCGSKSAPTDNQFKPDSWFYGTVDNIRVTLPFTNGIKGEAGHFCSVNCGRLFLGSFFTAAQVALNDQTDRWIANGGSTIYYEDLD